jgi:hypothetical protein
MNMQEPFSELMRVGRLEGAERRPLDLFNNSGEQGNNIKVELSQGMERNLTLATGSRTVSATGTITKETVTEEVDEEDDEVMFEMEKGPRMRLPSCHRSSDQGQRKSDQEGEDVHRVLLQGRSGS